MNFLRLLPVILSDLVLAAHFFRAGNLTLSALCVAALALLLVRRPWAARIIQLGLVLGSFEWVRVLVVLVAERRAEGMPWMRLTLILSAVALFTAAAALTFNLTAVRKRYHPS